MSNYKASELADIHSGMALCEAQEVIATIEGDNILVSSPYNPTLVQRINAVKPKLGRWIKTQGKWQFPKDKEQEVRALYKDVYGEDGFSESAKTDVIIDVDKAKKAGVPFEQASKSLWFLGKQLARTMDNKRTPKPTKGVTILSGGFVAGGTATRPTSEFLPNTKLAVTDVSSDLFTALVSDFSGETGLTAGGSSIANTATAAASGTAGKTASSSPSSSSSSSSPTSSTPAPRAASGNALGDSTSASDELVAELVSGLDKGRKAQYLMGKLTIASIGVRAKQLPRDVADQLLLGYGLKFKA